MRIEPEIETRVQMQQHPNTVPLLRAFLAKAKPKRVLEIGTGRGGFTLLLAGMVGAGNVRSYDKRDCVDSDVLDEIGVDRRIEDVFDHVSEIASYIKGRGRTVVFCDGGNKVYEVRKFAPLLKSGDYILAHDYAPDRHAFEAMDWRWHEIKDADIEQTVEECGLKYVGDLADVAWGAWRRSGG